VRTARGKSSTLRKKALLWQKEKGQTRNSFKTPCTKEEERGKGRLAAPHLHFHQGERGSTKEARLAELGQRREEGGRRFFSSTEVEERAIKKYYRGRGFKRASNSRKRKTRTSIFKKITRKKRGGKKKGGYANEYHFGVGEGTNNHGATTFGKDKNLEKAWEEKRFWRF